MSILSVLLIGYIIIIILYSPLHAAGGECYLRPACPSIRWLREQQWTLHTRLQVTGVNWETVGASSSLRSQEQWPLNSSLGALMGRIRRLPASGDEELGNTCCMWGVLSWCEGQGTEWVPGWGGGRPRGQSTITTTTGSTQGENVPCIGFHETRWNPTEKWLQQKGMSACVIFMQSGLPFCWSFLQLSSGMPPENKGTQGSFSLWQWCQHCSIPARFLQHFN